MRIFVFTMQMRLQNQKLKIWQIKQKARGKPCMNFLNEFFQRNCNAQQKARETIQLDIIV